MIRKFAIFIALSVLVGCGAYKQLKPKPEVLPQESSYIQILNKDKNFELKAGKRYFLQFPSIVQNNYYLVLRVENISQIKTYLTPAFDKNPKTPDTPVADQSSQSDDLEVYEISAGTPIYSWVIDEVRSDMLLNMEYRYVPIWRYRFERRYSEFQIVLSKNKADRDNFEAIGISRDPGKINYEQDMADLKRKTESLATLQSELGKIESIFPASIKSSDDQAYLDYIGMKSEVDEELQFQKDYYRLLSVLKKARESRFNKESFVENIPEFLDFFENENRYPENVRREVEEAVSDRLGEIVPFYENKVRRQRELAPIEFPADAAENLYRRTGKQPDANFQEFTRYVNSYNADFAAVEKAKNKLAEIRSKIRSGGWPSNSLFSSLRGQLNDVLRTLPRSTRDYGKYSTYSISSGLKQKISQLNGEVERLRQDLAITEDLVPQVNRLKDQGDYRGIIRLLKPHDDITFLQDLYSDVDQRSIDQQQREIEAALNNRQWETAERKIRALYEDRDFLNYSAFAARKLALSKSFEEQLVTAVEQASKDRINAFIEANKANFGDVEALYQSQAFRPVYTLTFSAGGQNVVDRYNKKVQDYLDTWKHDQFPKMAIENIYRDFSGNVRENGVAKAKAIIIHGKYYQGKDHKIKNLIAEINPSIPKWITKATEYRKIFVVPVNDKQQESNEYLFRINLKIPSEAKFPVYDVNIKLPREVAASAGNNPWYESMKMNKKVLKNEGRFTITAPTERNNFECQITPLQVNKEGNNILEVRFKYPAFKVMEISVMAQRPIIRRD